MTGALSNLRVLDLSRVLAGPWAGQILGDLGADVIKVERPITGDDTRSWGPPYLKDKDGKDREAAYYLGANRNKRSICVDLAHPDGQAIIRNLAAKSDILIENYKLGNLARFGLDYESLSAINPGLVYCSITGFGQSGPYADQAGYDFIVQGLSGLMSVTGKPDGPPTKVGAAVADLTTAMYGVIGILAALRHRDETGEGQHVDMALLDTQMGWLANQNMNYLIGGESPKRIGNAHLNIVPYQDFETSDGYIIVCVGNDRQFKRFCDAIGAPELARNPSFETNDLRVRHRDLLVPQLAEKIRRESTDHWLSKLLAVNVPHGPINSIAQAFADPQARFRQMRVDMAHPLGMDVPTVACPIHLSKTPVSYRLPPPLLGADSDAILEEIGIDAATRAALREKGAIG
ncbi:MULTISPECIES: CaiB/BaiF CoA-transferase family protein [unclassified Iodidimonas]|jgi:crotonobetainyl-CoA:carnitine CoA-transferase CaiB-like acyl-CoA transferase|uniref:CaiB/BaiF CoA transferase family protein n=1 Tax=unclassified Iodidimonas TaxID=2626145 RepID=UPI0024822721|nr:MULTISPECIES: CaiB/BaiF CoA-transferase family protein [unclassified Iodidimonas]